MRVHEDFFTNPSQDRQVPELRGAGPEHDHAGGGPGQERHRDQGGVVLLGPPRAAGEYGFETST